MRRLNKNDELFIPGVFVYVGGLAGILIHLKSSRGFFVHTNEFQGVGRSCRCSNISIHVLLI